MIKHVGYDIVFREIPDETTLAINLTLCPNHCRECHSAYLREDRGEILSEEVLDNMVSDYVGEVTCICFMGGDNDPNEVARLARHLHERYHGEFLTAWYSGKSDFPDGFDAGAFDFVKIGPYIPERGPLNKPTTNQRLYRMHADGRREDITFRLQQRP